MGGCSDGSCSSGSCSSSDKDRLPPGMLARYDLNQQTGLGTLVWAETEDGKISDEVIGILGKIRDVSDDRIFAMITGSVSVKPLYNILFENGVDTLYHIRCRDMEEYHPNAYAEALADIAVRVNPQAIVFHGTDRAKEVAETVGRMLGKDVNYCTDVSFEGPAAKVSSGNIICIIEEQPQIVVLSKGVSGKKGPIPGRKGTAISRPFVPKEL